MGDLISREDTIKLFLERKNELVGIQGDLGGAMSGAVKLIESLPSAEEWIPVSGGLPKKGGWYFVTWEDQFKTVRNVTISEFIEPKGLTDIGHFEGFVLREIIAWMPLPEPYKGGDAE